MDPLGSVPEEVGMELRPEGFGRGRKKGRLYRVGEGANEVRGGDDCAENEGWKQSGPSPGKENTCR